MNPIAELDQDVAGRLSGKSGGRQSPVCLLRIAACLGYSRWRSVDIVDGRSYVFP